MSSNFFPKTSLELLEDLRDGSKPRMDEFVERYELPTRAYIGAIVRDAARKLGEPFESVKDLADDLANQFFLEKVLSGKALQTFDPEKAARGFRPYFKQVLRHFLRDRMAKMPKLAAASLTDEDDRISDPGDSPETLYNRGWAQGMVGDAMKSTKELCDRDGHSQHFRLFVGFYFEDKSWEELAKSEGIPSGKAARNLAQTAERKFASILRTMAPEDELRDLLSAM